MAGGLSGVLKEMPAQNTVLPSNEKRPSPGDPGGWTFIIFMVQEMAVMISTKNEMINMVMRMLTV
ncbi:hypothetical protein SAMN04488126_11224 [Bhargavaea beijingensis]|uniref:Uncharacterized protein n=1 Tax=Bhargavaea beijingensis TaxID=426756 RepID=A0A1G7E2G3_9BACL|nr:hypothetical protein SAMN04488126_11224 [Bhargavaea beijingensis]